MVDKVKEKREAVKKQREGEREKPERRERHFLIRGPYLPSKLGMMTTIKSYLPFTMRNPTHRQLAGYSIRLRMKVIKTAV